MDRRTWLVLVGGMGCLLVGCRNSDRPPMAPVSGVVLYKGQPVAGATVTFFPETAGQRAAGAVTDESGRFVLMTYDEEDGAVLGKHRVAVIKRDTAATAPLPPGMGAAFQEELEAKAAEQGKPLLPSKYFVPETSGLEFDVVDGSNDFKLELVD